MTRAQRELYLSQCRVREFRGQRQSTIPSRFLSELPEDVVEVHDRSGMASSGSFTGIRRPDPQPTFSVPRPSAVSRGFNLTTAAALGSSPSFSAPVDLNSFGPGVSVLHPEYGLGRIVAIDGAGRDRKARVMFAVGGERTFVLSKSALKPIRGGAG